MLERLDVYLFMSEKEVAGVAFPLNDGRFDYFGFTSTDDQTHRWCRDLFLHYWEQAYPRLKMADELYWWMKQRPTLIHALKEIAAGGTVNQKRRDIRTGAAVLNQGEKINHPWRPRLCTTHEKLDSPRNETRLTGSYTIPTIVEMVMRLFITS